MSLRVKVVIHKSDAASDRAPGLQNTPSSVIPTPAHELRTVMLRVGAVGCASPGVTTDRPSGGDVVIVGRLKHEALGLLL